MNFDDSEWPILRVRFSGEKLPSDFSVTDKLNEMTLFLSRAEQFIIVIDYMPYNVYMHPFTEDHMNTCIAWLKLTNVLTCKLCMGVLVTNIQNFDSEDYKLCSKVVNQIPHMPKTSFFDSKQELNTALFRLLA